MRRQRRTGVIPVLLLLTCFFCLSKPMAADRKPVTLSSKDKCPVCGMFVKKYPDWISQIVFKDGSYAVFDGAKDMFKYHHNMARYAPGHRQADIDAIYVTDYYSVELIDAYKAYYVVGSNVYGPMGHELIPFRTEADAKEFIRDHKGKKILTFIDVTQNRLKDLD